MELLREWTHALGDVSFRDAALWALGLTVLWIATSAVASWAQLRHVPGPFLASFTNLWVQRAMASGRFYEIIQTEQQRHGRVMRMGPDSVCVYEPEALWRINAARSAYARGPWYSALRFDPRGHSIFSECDTSRHDRRKAKLAAGYSGKRLLDLESHIDAGLAQLVRHLHKYHAQTVDIGRLLQFFQVDLISKAGFGQAWGDLADETDHFDYLKDGEANLAFLHTVSLSPVTRAIFNSLFFIKLFGRRLCFLFQGICVHGLFSVTDVIQYCPGTPLRDEG